MEEQQASGPITAVAPTCMLHCNIDHKVGQAARTRVLAVHEQMVIVEASRLHHVQWGYGGHPVVGSISEMAIVESR